MAKPTTAKIRLNSEGGTGFFYVTKKNTRTMTEKFSIKKYDPVLRKHVSSRKARSSRHSAFGTVASRAHAARSFPTFHLNNFDVLIVGGGATGCFTARDAAMRGL